MICVHVPGITSLRLSRQPIPLFPAKELAALSSVFVDIITRCTVEEPLDRPKVRSVISSLKLLGHKSTVIDDILDRLQAYSVQLEATVASRTHEVLAEMAKVDALLKEIIPR